jgi:hypothetical protein
MFKLFAAAAGIAGFVASVPAQSQGIQLQMSDNNLSRFCFWNSRIFSIGSFFCVEKNKMLQCNTTKDKEERATWEILDRGACTKSDIPK